MVTTPDRVFVCAGYTQAMHLICQTLRGQGATSIAFEDPGEPGCGGLAAQTGLATAHVPVDEDGLVVDRLADPAAVAVTPAHQYPLGMTLSPPRRTQLLAWAARTGAYVIEDDYDGEFRYDRQPVGALQGLAPDRVIYAGTASKTVAPGLRLAWLAVPPNLIGPLRESMRWEEAHVSVIEQLVLARLIDTGELDRHLRRCRIRYRRRRDRLGSAILQEVPSGRLSGIAAGLHAVLRLPDAGMPEERLLTYLRGRGVWVDGIEYFYHRTEDAPLGVIVGYATPPEHAYNNALDTLITALRDLHRGPGGER